MRLLSCQAALRIRIHYILSYPDLDPLFPKGDPRIRIHYTGKVDPRIWIHYSKLWIPGLCSLSIWKRKWEALINHVGGSPEYVVVFNPYERSEKRSLYSCVVDPAPPESATFFRIRIHYLQSWIRLSGSTIPERWFRESGSGSTSKWDGSYLLYLDHTFSGPEKL